MLTRRLIPLYGVAVPRCDVRRPRAGCSRPGVTVWRSRQTTPHSVRSSAAVVPVITAVITAVVTAIVTAVPGSYPYSAVDLVPDPDPDPDPDPVPVVARAKKAAEKIGSKRAFERERRSSRGTIATRAFAVAVAVSAAKVEKKEPGYEEQSCNEASWKEDPGKPPCLGHQFWRRENDTLEGTPCLTCSEEGSLTYPTFLPSYGPYGPYGPAVTYGGLGPAAAGPASQCLALPPKYVRV
ncbi:hypothetical protein L249_1020 [Ophiocordyceps polyrhachis-furcata BCC 54312]|uniref:Uncharacterized protein n=1 Tax=Ophiocordyceps polyrhachis-furcata BCC 54312 TaxID=1330021 RepID=A0A367LDW5_9HYPO|nr:hypothetical protein L249_1020 [Ophiocordyceps polyrhachis-furcata BCC 54312]